MILKNVNYEMKLIKINRVTCLEFSFTAQACYVELFCHSNFHRKMSQASRCWEELNLSKDHQHNAPKRKN